MPADVAAPAPVPLLDRLVAWIAPDRALRRARARAALAILRGYEGATRSRRTEDWQAARGSSANSELAASLPLLRDRSRDHVRNNPYGRRAVRALASSLVGFGMTGTITGKNKRTVAQLQAAWDGWASATTCDQRGKQTFGGLQRLVARTWGESGEVLGRRVWDGTVPMGFRVQVLEPDYLDSPFTGVTLTQQHPVPDGHRLVAGVELDADDRPAAYWLLARHPGDPWGMTLAPAERVPAADMLHVYDEERPGQVRGCPILAPVLIPLRDLDECKDAHQIRQKIAACFAVFYSVPEGSTRTKDTRLTEKVEPGLIEELPPGWEPHAFNPPGVEGYADVMRIGLQAIAAGTGIPYEELSGDYSQFNFSSGRMSRGSYYGMVEELQWQLIIPGFADRVFGWFLEAARIQGYDTAGVSMTWTVPRRPLVDPTHEIPAAISAVRATLSSPQEAIRELGYEPEAVLREWDQFAKLLDEFELVSDLDPRRTTNQGARVVLPTDEAPPPAPGAKPPPAAPRARSRRRPVTNGHAPVA